MNVRGRTAGRLLVLALAALAVVVIVGATGSSSQVAATSAPPAGPGVGSAPAPIGSGSRAGVVSSAAFAAPSTWCCPGASRPGLTVTGQATLLTQGVAARDAAIARAVADAKDQAQTAADAAGISLGRILDLQVSAQPTVYPVLGASGTGRPDSTAEPVPYPSLVSVTITWAIG